MFKQICALILALFLLPAAMAEETIPYQVFTFAASLPAMLKEPLSALVPDESRILSGAAIQHNGYHDGDDPDSLDSYTAMLLVDTADGLQLYAAAQVEGLPWQINDYTHLLRQGRNVSVSIYQPQNTRVPVFSMDYYAPEGLMSDLFCFWGNQIWCVDGHINKTLGITIANEMNALSVTDNMGRETFWCDTPFYLDYMQDVSTLPTSRVEAQALCRETVYGSLAAGSTVYCTGANLRMEPTSKSESLGMYATNTPMTFTGETRQGAQWPWYQVRIGDMVGWMSSNYVSHHSDYGFGPVPMGRTVDGCDLYSSAGDSQPITRLEPGTTFHILTEYKGMYHICIPQGDISWAVDTEGTYGYISTKNVLTGASISALDTLQTQ